MHHCTSAYRSSRYGGTTCGGLDFNRAVKEIKMARPYTARVNHHVTYYDAACKPRPATIIAVTSNTVVNLRVSHNATAYVGIVRAPGNTKVVNTWRPA